MVEIIATVLVVLWLLGVVSGHTFGNYIYVLLAVAIVSFLTTMWGSSKTSGQSIGGSSTKQP
jgi:Family of unknown function (DUF5670)